MEFITNRGKLTVLIDDADTPLFSGYCISCSFDRRGRKWYAYAHRREGGKPVSYSVARMILGLQKGDKREGEHINPNATLDNRRSNLRIATRAQNNANRRMRKDNTSGFKGVSAYRGKWKAQIQINNRAINLGTCTTKQVAYELYCKAARELHGEFARMECRTDG